MPELHLSNGQVDYYTIDDFTDPWRADDVDIVVFQAGITRHTDMLFHLVPLLASEVRLIRRDLRGHGHSSTGNEPGYPYTLDTLVDEMAEFVDKVAKRPVHWIGESTAGMLTIAFAKKYPEKLKSIIIMSSPLVLGEAFRVMTSEPYQSPGEAVRKLGLVEWQRSRPMSKLGTNQKIDKTNDMGRFSGPGYTKWFEDSLAVHSTEGIALFFDFIMTVDVRDYLDSIKVSTLVLSPRNSMASPVAVNEEIGSRIKDSRMVIVESVGHIIYMDKPKDVCDAILTWIRDLQTKKSIV